jgi:polyhydroxybutyrate depolymerase
MNIFLGILTFGSCTQAVSDSEKVQDKTIPIGTSEYTFSHQGQNRSYLFHAPEGLSNNASIVLVMHGYSSNAQTIMEYSNFNALADEHKFVVVYPQGTTDSSGYQFFNVGYNFHNGVEIDDLDFIRSLIASLQEKYSLSTQNVFSTGMSNGGDMSYLLACSASDVFRAIAPVSGTMMQTIYNSCSPQKPMPVFEIHGTDDRVTLWDGDPNNADGWGVYLDIPSIISFWATHNNVEAQEVVYLENRDTQDGSEIIFHAYGQASDPAQVWLYEVRGGAHDWPGAFGNKDIDTSAEIWRFFSQYQTQ